MLRRSIWGVIVGRGIKAGRLHAAPIHKFTFSCIEYTRICS